MNLENPWQRLIGLAVVLTCLALYEPGAHGVAHRLVYPLAMAAGAWALVQNLAVVALTGSVLALVHSDLGAEGWVERLAYPGLAVAGLLCLAWIGVRRFRVRIVETREARWTRRHSR